MARGGAVGALCHGPMRASRAGKRDIAGDVTLRASPAAAGFDPGPADRGRLLGPEIQAAELEDAVARGVFGLPFGITEGKARFRGQDRPGEPAARPGGRLWRHAEGRARAGAAAPLDAPCAGAVPTGGGTSPAHSAISARNRSIASGAADQSVTSRAVSGSSSGPSSPPDQR